MFTSLLENGFEDVRVMLHLLDDLGVAARFEHGTVELCAAGLRSTNPSSDLCRRARARALGGV